jgi:hypothetical protein
MRQRAKIVLGFVVAVGVVLVLFFAPVVPISVKYQCFGTEASCVDLSYSTYASPTFAAFGVGSVYVVNNNYPSGNQYCWMNGNPVGNPSVNNDAMCNIMVQ